MLTKSPSPLLARRTLLAAVPGFALLAACSKAVGEADGQWQQSGNAEGSIDHGPWDRLLTKYVKATPDGLNRVDYAAFKAGDASTLKRYLDSLQAIAIETYSRDEQFAFWVNLYNAATVDVILDNYPLQSIRDIGLLGAGPWKDEILKVSGRDLTLDTIEHEILRPVWKDVRIHYAVNCASVGCPNLATRAYTVDRLEMMLEEAARAYVNHPRGFMRRDGGLVASSIYDWYGSDWGDQAAILAHARRYASEATSAMLNNATRIDSFDYDWALNDVTA